MNTNGAAPEPNVASCVKCMNHRSVTLCRECHHDGYCMVTSPVTSQYHTPTARLLHSRLKDRSNAQARFNGHCSEIRLVGGMSRQGVMFCVNTGPSTRGLLGGNGTILINPGT
jgi:hypothetical protein